MQRWANCGGIVVGSLETGPFGQTWPLGKNTRASTNGGTTSAVPDPALTVLMMFVIFGVAVLTKKFHEVVEVTFTLTSPEDAQTESSAATRIRKALGVLLCCKRKTVSARQHGGRRISINTIRFHMRSIYENL